MERRVGFGLDAGNQREGANGFLSKGRLLPSDNQWARASIGGGRGLYVDGTVSS